jgi:hypothetical protein
MHLKPTVGCQISTLIFRFGEGTLYISHEKLPKDAKVFATLRLSQMYCPGLYLT